MTVRRCIALLTALALGLALRGGLRAAQAPNFDRLSEEDRQAFAERFRREVWPLLERNGKDGCVGCHRDAKIVSALRMSGDADKDYRMLLRDGFFLKGDAGSLLSRILETDRKRVMPPSKFPRWTEAEVKTLRDFVEDVHQKQKK
jgi:hypothetical protein